MKFFTPFFVLFTMFITGLFPSLLFCDESHETLSQSQLHDKIRGGLLGQIFANLNGLKHEFKYIAEPGNVQAYIPDLAEGARTDDDTDVEWVYALAMQKVGLYVPYTEIPVLWKSKINRSIWCSHQYVRFLFDMQVPAELTGSPQLNPWAEFNIAGQFTCEMFGLISPGMPQTASKLGTHYLRVAVDAEPLQTTQLYDTMIATAFLTNDLEKILEAGLAAVDPKSRVYSIVHNVKKWHQENPDDWKQTRRLIRDTYTQYQGTLRDQNGYELNTAATIAAFLYGKGDYVSTAIHAFNFGWDADNTAATAGTMIGVMRGEKWFHEQGWKVLDTFKNTTRDNMPNDETITSYGDRLIELAQKNIQEHGGKFTNEDGISLFTIPTEQPANVISVKKLSEIRSDSLRNLSEDICSHFSQEKSESLLARDAYVAICLDFDNKLNEESPEVWKKAVEALNRQKKFLNFLFVHSNAPSAVQLKTKLLAAGIDDPRKDSVQ